MRIEYIGREWDNFIYDYFSKWNTGRGRYFRF